ncbi:MAG: hypothetical protein KGR26_13985, partial [Cyanobacteria bacterium REEB65]|nr:hypothetical protein [Cyanobacteria bacterium REEB65]
MIQRLGRWPGQPLRIIDYGPTTSDMRSATLGGWDTSKAIPPTVRAKKPYPKRRAAIRSEVPHVVARLGSWGVECSCGFQSGMGEDMEREW